MATPAGHEVMRWLRAVRRFLTAANGHEPPAVIATQRQMERTRIAEERLMRRIGPVDAYFPPRQIRHEAPEHRP